MEKKENRLLHQPSHPFSLAQDLQCVWVRAGLLSYKLCKYNFECERCPLDWELRNLSVESALPLGSLGATLREEASLFQIKESLFYHPGHTWVKVEKVDEVRVGLDPFLGRLLEGVKVVVLPLSGTRGVRGENLCSIIFEEGIVQITFPVSGLILSVNPKLKDHPELLCTDPFEEGFLLTLKPKNLQRDQKYLMTGEEASFWAQREWERFKEIILSELRCHQHQAERTMQDGAMDLNEIKHLLPPNRFLHLVNCFLRGGEPHVLKISSKGDLSFPSSRD